MDNIPDIESEFQEAGVFYNGNRGENSFSHMDSYMSCINEKVLEETWTKIKDKYTKQDWLNCIEYWKDNAYLSPNCHLMSFFVNRKLMLDLSH